MLQAVASLVYLDRQKPIWMILKVWQTLLLKLEQAPSEIYWMGSPSNWWCPIF